MNHAIGRVIFYEEDPSNPASGFDAGAYVPNGHNYLDTVAAMAMDRPAATVCIKPVDVVPEWVTA